LALATLLRPSEALSQSATIAGYRYPYGAQETLSSGCQSDSCTAYIDPQDSNNYPMPKVAVYISNSTSFPTATQVDWTITVSYTDPYGLPLPTPYSYSGTTSPSSAILTMGAGSWDQDVGGTATVTAILRDCTGDEVGSSAPFTFYILGKIQSEAQVDDNKGGMPWFTGSMITAESCAAQNAGQADQFSPTNGFCSDSENAAGYPLFGPTDGIGLMQPDRSQNPAVFSDCTYFNFLCNMSSAEQVLTSKGSESENNWLTQYETNSHYTAVTGDQGYPSCSFQTSTEPLGDHSYGDADWIQDYNTHSGGYYYLWWNASTHEWNFKYNNPSQRGYNYVPEVCNSASY
ncbi:MAG: hypothetical protein ACRD18_13540, partial [Terriglobia bacterium]